MMLEKFVGLVVLLGTGELELEGFLGVLEVEEEDVWGVCGTAGYLLGV